MAPRLNKRQQRELEELEALGGNNSMKVSEEEEEGSEEEIPKSKPGASGFAALFTAEEEEIEESEDDSKSRSSKSKKSKKKKKATIPVEIKSDIPIKSGPSTPSGSIPPLPKNEKKAAKKAKAKAKKAGIDEIDEALEALSIKHPEFKRNLANANMNTMTRSLSSLFAVSPAHLDSESELKKFFGSKVVAANKDKASGSSKRAHVTQRSVLTKPQPNWPPAHMREGLSAKQLTDEEVAEKFSRNRWTDSASGTLLEGERWWTIEYSKKYKSMTMLFLQVVASGDPQGFYGLIQRAPWHADSWLQLAEVFRHREEHSSAVDAVDRVMFAYERAFVGGFSFTTGLNRLDFDRVENRPFYLALHRQASDLQRRGCMRTAFEFTKLMYSLDPWCDPHGALLHLDFLAFKAGMPQWLLDVFNLFDEKSGASSKSSTSTCRMDPSVLPGWAFARALALRLTNKEQDKSTSALIEAADSFPSIVPLLADKLDVALPANIRGHKDFRIQTDSRSLSTPVAILHLLSHIYVQRSFSLWKDPKIADWFTETMTSHFSSLPSSLPSTSRRNRFIAMYSEGERTGSLPYAVYRHLLVLETTLSFRSLLPFVPNSVLSSNNSGLACDPLPPPSKVRLSEYGDEFFAGIDQDEELFGSRRRLTRREREMQERRLARLIPDVHERRQVQAIFENNAAFQQRFPGPDGILQFAQAMEMLPPDALEDLLAVAAMNPGEPVDNREMPGQMPGLEDILLGAGMNDALGVGAGAGNEQNEGGEDEDLSGDEDEDEDISPLPVRIIRNFLGRFWGGAGGGANADDSESDDESEERLRDEAGVD